MRIQRAKVMSRPLSETVGLVAIRDHRRIEQIVQIVVVTEDHRMSSHVQPYLHIGYQRSQSHDDDEVSQSNDLDLYPGYTKRDHLLQNHKTMPVLG